MPGADLTPPKNGDATLYEMWRELSLKRILAGNLVSGSVTSASSTLLNHGLGRKYIGALVVGNNGTAAVHPQRPAETDAETNGDSSSNILVKFFPASSTLEFNLWVF